MTRRRTKQYKPVSRFPWGLIPIAAIVAMLGFGVCRILFYSKCRTAEAYVNAMEYCQQWASRGLCVIGVDTLVRYREESEILRSKFCKAKGFFNPNDPRNEDEAIVIELR